MWRNLMKFKYVPLMAWNLGPNYVDIDSGIRKMVCPSSKPIIKDLSVSNLGVSMLELVHHINSRRHICFRAQLLHMVVQMGPVMSSTTRRSGGDGVTVEESKEADTITGKATHRIACGIGNKGHALTKKLDCNGKVNAMQTLQNLHEDELAGFEESWQRNAGQCLPSWDPRVNMLSSGTPPFSVAYVYDTVVYHVIISICFFGMVPIPSGPKCLKMEYAHYQ